MSDAAIDEGRGTPVSGQALLPSRRYAEGVARGDWNDDPAQHAALRELDRLHAMLLQPARRGLFEALLGRRP